MANVRKGFVYKFNGKYAVISDRTTHTGRYIDVEWTPILDDATVMYSMNYRLEKEYLPEGTSRLGVKETKTVEFN
jgi:hypothetical protein